MTQLQSIYFNDYMNGDIDIDVYVTLLNKSHEA